MLFTHLSLFNNRNVCVNMQTKQTDIRSLAAERDKSMMAYSRRARIFSTRPFGPILYNNNNNNHNNCVGRIVHTHTWKSL